MTPKTRDEPVDLALLSSGDGLKIAREVERGLRRRKLTTSIWDRGNFRPGLNVLESVKQLIMRARGVVLVMTPDHEVELGGARVRVPRDNLVFEFGLSVGLLGDARTFVVRPRDSDFHLPTDTGGVIYLTYDTADEASRKESIAEACRAIEDALEEPTEMSVATWYESLRKMDEMVHKSGKARGAVDQIDLVIGSNPGGAAIGGMLYFVGGRWFDKAQFLAFSHEADCEEEMKAVIRALARPRGRRQPRVLVVDASIKRGESMAGVVALVREALDGKVDIRTAVLIDMPGERLEEYSEDTAWNPPDYVVAPATYGAFPYGLA